MAVTNKFSPYAVSLGTTLLGGIQNHSINMGTEVRTEPTSGDVFGKHQSISRIMPTASVTSLHVAHALDVLGITGADIAALTGGMSIYAYKHLEGGSRAGASAHRKYNATAGMVVPTRITVNDTGDATIAFDATFKSSGTVHPIALTDSFTLPTGATSEQRFALGPATFGAILLTHKRSLDVDFGLRVEAVAADSDIYPSFTSIQTGQMRVTMRGINLLWLTDVTGIPREGLEGTHANSTFYLRKRTNGGTFEADGSAVHIKFTAAGLIHIDTPIDAGMDDAAECSLVFDLKHDGTNNPLTVDTTSTIT